MMLLDNKYRNYDFPSISDDEAMLYSKWINGNYPDECKCKLKKIVAFLDNLFYQKEKNLRKINIPILFLMADKALKHSISGTNFRKWYYDFFENHKDEYGQFCSSGSVKKEKTLGRIEVMEKCFDDYFRPDEAEIKEKKGSIENETAEIAESIEQSHSDAEEADSGDSNESIGQDNNADVDEKSGESAISGNQESIDTEQDFFLTDLMVNQIEVMIQILKVLLFQKMLTMKYQRLLCYDR